MKKDVIAFLSLGAIIAGLNYYMNTVDVFEPFTAPTHEVGLASWKNLTSSKAETYAIKAYQKAKARGQTTSSIVVFIDFTIPSTQRRLWVIDVTKHKVLYNVYTTHGAGSGKGLRPTSFSNTPGSKQTSLGVYKTGSVYFGKHGRSLTLYGLEKGVNDNASNRAIVIHPVTYIGNGKTGTSWGCFGLETSVSNSIIDTIKNGSILLAYYPDSKWLNNSEYLK
jgi:hypothetical protein